MKGIVRKYIPVKRFGFIVGEDGEDYFYHTDNTIGTIRYEGMEVEFDIESVPTFKEAGVAINVRKTTENKMDNRQWMELLAKEFNVSNRVAKDMFHSLLEIKRMDTVRKNIRSKANE